MARYHFLPVLLIVAMVGCGAVGASEGPVRGPSAAWSAEILGQPADVTFHLNMAGLLADPLYGPPLARAISTMGAGRDDDYPMIRISAPDFYARTVVDVFATLDPTREDVRTVIVIRGVPNIDPRGLHSRNDHPDLSPNVRTFPSGVSEFLSSGRSKEFVLYVMPDRSTWVVTDDATARRAGPYFWSSGTAPPPPRVDASSLASLFVGQRTLDFAYVLASRQGVSADGIVGMQSAAITLRPGRENTILGRFEFDSGLHAASLAGLLDRNTPCQAKACAETRDALKDLPTSVSQNGSEVRTTTMLTAKLLGSVFPK